MELGYHDEIKFFMDYVLLLCLHSWDDVYVMYLRCIYDVFMVYIYELYD